MTSQLYDQYRDRIFRFVLPYVTCPATAEDIVQETFIVYMTQKVAVDAPLKYLCGVARNLANRQRRRALEPLTMEPESHSVIDTPCTELLASLPEHAREAVWLAYVENRSSKEIGKRLGITASAARKLTERYLKKLGRK
jgi:RNA polymerase sigma factor (sigma-70 family)